MFIKHWRSENSSATTQNSLAKFCLFPDRALSFHDNRPVTLQYSPVSPILNETPEYLEFYPWTMYSRESKVLAPFCQ